MLNRKDLFEAIFCIVFGLYFLIFHNWMIKGSVKFQKKIFGLNVDPVYYKFAYSIGGIFFLIIGILILFGLVKLGK